MFLVRASNSVFLYKAKPYVEQYMHHYPDFTISGHRELLHIKRDEDRVHYLEGLRLAGTPA